MSKIKLNHAIMRDLLSVPGGELCLAIGVFDGVHLGHRRIISELAEMAARYHALPAALTFDPHPKAVLTPGEAPTPLTPLARRAELLREAGAGAVEIIRFTPEFSRMLPEEFLDFLLKNPGGRRVRGIVVGANWRFGRDGAGTADALAAAAEREGFEFRCVSLLSGDGGQVSSTRIRAAAERGDLEGVRALLGRDCELYGRVVPDLNIGGPLLGCPTANLELCAGVLPPDGVYAGRCNGLPAVVNIGFSPSVAANRMRHRIEAHILDRELDLRGREAMLQLVSFIRPERKFATLQELRRRIAADIAEAEKTLTAKT